MDEPTPAAPADTASRLVAFDVDGTLTRRDSVVPFMWMVGGVRWLWRCLVAAPDLLRAFRQHDRDAIKAVGTAAAFGGVSVDEVQRLADRHAREIHERHLRPDTTRLLREHLDRGDTVVLVSASYEVYLRPLARRLGVAHVLGTRLEAVDGRLTGRLDGPNCRGAEKVRRLTSQWNDAGRGSQVLVAYGDSAGDRELLAHADIAHWVGGRTLAGPADPPREEDARCGAR